MIIITDIDTPAQSAFVRLPLRLLYTCQDQYRKDPYRQLLGRPAVEGHISFEVKNTRMHPIYAGDSLLFHRMPAHYLVLNRGRL